MTRTHFLALPLTVIVAACVLDFGKFEEETPGSGGAPTTTSTTGGGGDLTISVGGGATTSTTSTSVGGGMASCDNNVKDGSESDVDCGGGICPDCPNGSLCNDASDCESVFCDATGKCAPCGDHTDCASGDFCDSALAGGTCVAKLSNGQPCSDALACVSGVCSDGVCCAGLCDGMCQGCASVLTALPNGTCGPIIGGTDPDLECPGQVCDGSGACADHCGLVPAPPGGMCPAVCNGGCTAAGKCMIACTQMSSCAGATVACPPGFACEVQCSSNNSCNGATILCPEGYACDVSCSANSTCANAIVTCASGVCSLACSSNNSACQNAMLQCGDNSCSATCAGASKPNVTCGTSCDCTPCP